MIEEAGYLALVIALGVSLFGAAAAAYGARRGRPGWVESGRRALLLVCPRISLAALAIILLLVGERYDIEYVANVTSQAMPPYLKITALWGGQAGSLVFWSWLMAAFASAAALRRWDRDAELLPWVTAVALGTLAFFLVLVAWLFLSLGLLLGGPWAYDVLGWGGYWCWDPVEIAAFMPWLSGTAFLHSVMVQEKKGMLKHWNMLLIILTYALVIFGTFLTRSGVLSSVHAFAQSAIGPMFFAFIGLTTVASLSLLMHRWPDLRSENQLGSLLSRESLFLLNNLLFMGILIVCFWGVLFPLISELFTGQKVTVGPPFYERATAPLFGGLLLLMGVAPLAAWRHSTAKTLGRSMWKPFIASLVVLAFVLLTGVRNPIAPLGFWLCAFVAVVPRDGFGRGARAPPHPRAESLPLALWRLAGRNRRRYGGYVIHLGVVLMAIGIIGIELFQSETQGTIP